MVDKLGYRFFILPSSLWSDVLALRMHVFVTEMGVPEALEVDEYDQSALHLGVYLSDSKQGVNKQKEKMHPPVGTLRLLEQGDKAKIGRLAVRKEYRRQGIGQAMMQHILHYCQQQGISEVHLDAQTYIRHFYAQLGFIARGQIFDDAGIPHQKMYCILRQNGL